MSRRRHIIGVEWVKEGGMRHHVSEYARITDTRARPLVTCLECGAPMRLKLGSVNRHHASHLEENARCPASHPETALHINTKLYLAAQLEVACGAASVLSAEQRCLVGDPALKRRSEASEEFARAFASDDPDFSLERIGASGTAFLARRLDTAQHKP